ncbi:hypothetical protein CANINC_002986 [Pichia inconspicua]|uniref:DNA-directed RNA polymerase III subunit RPC5 n=1 Tax=Pichia inconspicua TaxID=52247 RepID=A0A4T0X083_9ASCO|nr:hypothetical protein CANINC_002986 [[Candida] inconspicua]
MTSLFVSEEIEETAEVKLEPGVEVSESMEVDRVDIKIEGEIQDKKNEDLSVYQEDSASESEDEDDPIIDTIPVHLNSNFTKKHYGEEGKSPLAPLLLQFPNKSGKSKLTQAHISALHRMQIKHESGVVELRLPLHTDSFFSGNISEKYGITEQFLRGVIIHDEPKGTIFEGRIPSMSVINKKDEETDSKDQIKQEISSNIGSNTIRTQPGSVGGSRYLIGLQDEEGHMHLTPISDTCMLRPHFSYIDEAKMNKLEREKEIERELNENVNNEKNIEKNDEDRKKTASVVTMSAKSTKENIPRLGGALMSAKLEKEEEGKSYEIIKCDGEFIGEQFFDDSGKKLHSKLNQEEYLDLLLRQTQL